MLQIFALPDVEQQKRGVNIYALLFVGIAVVSFITYFLQVSPHCYLFVAEAFVIKANLAIANKFLQRGQLWKVFLITLKSLISLLFGYQFSI